VPSGVCGPDEPSRGTRSRKPARECCLALGFILLIGSILSVRPAFTQLPGNPLPLTTARATITSDSAPSPNAQLILRVYNYARIDPVSLASSEKVAAAVFQNVGVAIVWVDCPLSQVQSARYPACQEGMGTTDLVLKIIPHYMAMKLEAQNEPLGIAKPCPESEPACELSVLYYRVDELATRGYRADRILGHVIAHEVGHVLGSGHSDVGIMRGEWSRYDLQRISWGLLLDFTDDQSRQLRSAVLRRAQPHQPAAQGVT
jgi:hypothetical protein